MEELKVELRSEVHELKSFWRGVHERQPLEQKVALLRQRPPAPVPDPFLLQVPSMFGKAQACMAHLRGRVRVQGVQAEVVLLASTCNQNFKGSQTKIVAHAQDIASLKSANERLEVQNSSLIAQVAELGGP